MRFDHLQELLLKYFDWENFGILDRRVLMGGKGKATIFYVDNLWQ